MSERVVGTGAAKQAATDLKARLAAVQQELDQLDKFGKTLSDPNKWDGRHANQFRSQQWPQASASNRKLVQHLEELDAQAQKIIDNIIVAGDGGAAGAPPTSPGGRGRQPN